MKGILIIMKASFLNRCLAAVSAGIIGICGINLLPVTAVTSDIPVTSYTVSYNLEGLTPATYIVTDDEGNKVTLTYEIPEPLSAEANKPVTLSSSWFVPESGIFMGWTYDEIYMFEPGDVFTLPENDVVLQPVIRTTEQSKVRYCISYDTVDHDTGIDWIMEGVVIEPTIHYPNSAAKIKPNSCRRDGYDQNGWTDGENVFTFWDKMLMPEHDVILYPIYFKHYEIYYETGDVDNVIGANSVQFTRREGAIFELADSTRLSRTGYKLTGWRCDVDGVIYKTTGLFTMPSSDVHMTAVWENAEYSLVFSNGITPRESYTIKALYDSEITLPGDIFLRPGYKIAAWNCNGEIFEAGKPFTVPAAKTGTVSLTAVWEVGAPVIPDSVDAFSLVELRQASEPSKKDIEDTLKFLLASP